MVSDWLKKKRNQREPIILELFWQQNSVRKWPRFSANNDLTLQAKQLKNFKNIPKPEHSKKYVFRAKYIENVVLKEKYCQQNRGKWARETKQAT